MAELLSKEDIERELTNLPGWEHNDKGLVKTWTRKGFNGAMQLANVVAWVATETKHHPDITVHDYNQLTVTTTTHDAGGVTENDIELARNIRATLGGTD